jgi:uncharacterized caspase-like protein
MVKIALLIGVSEYQSGFTPLPAAKKDVEAIQRVLQNPEIGCFDEVKQLINPEPQPMLEAIETLFNGRQKDDLLLLFFSGHGIKDEKGKLYLATAITYKNAQGGLVRSTAVAASFVHEAMSNSRSKRKVVILDSCFSGAFAEGLSAKDDGLVDIKNQLGGEGSAVLTSSTSTQYSFEQQGSDLSVYTRYLVEGIENGEADRNNDGVVSVDELHEYAREKVRETTSAMNPEIYAVKEGFKIHLAKTLVADPKVKYRSVVERCVHRSNGEISRVERKRLDLQRKQLGLSPVEARTIEIEVLTHYEEHKEKLQEYKEILIQEIQREFPVSQETRNELKRLQQALVLSDKDVALIEEQVTPRWSKAVQLPIRFSRGWVTQANTKRVNLSSVPQSGTALRKTALLAVIFLGIMGSVGGLIVWLRLEQPKKIQKAQALVEEACNPNSSLNTKTSQDRLKEANIILNKVSDFIGISDETAKNELVKQIQYCGNKLSFEEEIQKNNQEGQVRFQKAIVLARKAFAITYTPPNLNINTVEKWQEAETLWQKAIDILQSIPASSDTYKEAQSKLKQYQKYLANAKNSLQQERKAVESIKTATELYEQVKETIKNFKNMKDLKDAELKLQDANDRLDEIAVDGTTVSSKLYEKREKNRVLESRIIEMNSIEGELGLLLEKVFNFTEARLTSRNENNYIEIKTYLSEIDNLRRNESGTVRNKLKRFNSLVENLDNALNEYNFALKILKSCEDEIQPCIVEKGVSYLPEKSPFKAQLIQQYNVQPTSIPGRILDFSLGKKYIRLNDALEKIFQDANSYMDITKRGVEDAKRTIVEDVN